MIRTRLQLSILKSRHGTRQVVDTASKVRCFGVRKAHTERVDGLRISLACFMTCKTSQDFKTRLAYFVMSAVFRVCV